MPRTSDSPRSRTYLERLAEVAGRKGSSFVGGLVGTVEGTARGVEAFTPNKILGIIPSPEKAIAKWVADRAQIAREFYTPQDPTFADKVASGFGSMTGFMIPGLGITKSVQAANMAPRLANWLGASSSAVLEAMTEGGFAYQQALAKGMDEDQAKGAGAKTFWLNLPTIVFTNKAGVFSDKGGIIRRGLVSAPIEGVQEWSQEVIKNIALHDEPFKGAVESFQVGAVVGGISGGFLGGIFPEQFVPEFKNTEEAERFGDSIKGNQEAIVKVEKEHQRLQSEASKLLSQGKEKEYLKLISGQKQFVNEALKKAKTTEPITKKEKSDNVKTIVSEDTSNLPKTEIGEVSIKDGNVSKELPPPPPPTDIQDNPLGLPDPEVHQGSYAFKQLGDLVKYYLGNKLERWQTILGEQRGKEVFQRLRFYDRSVNLMQAEIEKRNIDIFKGISEDTRKHIFRVLKGVRGLTGSNLMPTLKHAKNKAWLIGKSIDEAPTIVFGTLQPSGLVQGEYQPGQMLEDGRVVGAKYNDNEHITYRYFETSEEYKKLIKEFPKAKDVIDKYIAAEEEIKQTKLGHDIPAFSREVLKDQFAIFSSHPDNAYAYVPSVMKEQKFFAKLKNMFRSYTAPGRKKKVGALAEQQQEDEDILKAYTIRQQELAYENLYNNVAGDILSVVLEPIENGKMKSGYVAVNVNHPRVARITELKKDLFQANGIDPDNLSLYQFPREVERELNIQNPNQFGNETLQKAHDSFRKVTNFTIGGITTNYLVRPSTANRNFLSGMIQYQLRSLTHFYEGMLGKGYIRFGEDIKSLFTALGKEAREELPAEVLGATFFTDIAQKKSLFAHALKPFRAVEYYFKRASFWSDLNAAALEKFRDSGLPSNKREQFIKDYRKNYFVDLFQTMSDNSDSVTFDYWNKPYVLERLNKGLVPFPNYVYHKWRMYAEYSPLTLKGMNRSNATNKIAKTMAGLTVASLAWAVSGEFARKRKEQLDALALKRIDFKFDTTGRVEFFSDRETERWLRVYDWPILGDLLYLREMKNGQADLGDWLTDGISFGPLLTMPLIMFGLKTKYQKFRTTPSLIGEQVAGYIPFAAYLRYLRTLQDPIKRQVFDEDFSAFENFINPIVNTLPGGSQFLDPSIVEKGFERFQVRKYDISGEAMKLLFLNIKSINRREFMDYVDEQRRPSSKGGLSKVQRRIRNKEKREERLRRVIEEYEFLKKR